MLSLASSYMWPDAKCTLWCGVETVLRSSSRRKHPCATSDPHLHSSMFSLGTVKDHQALHIQLDIPAESRYTKEMATKNAKKKATKIANAHTHTRRNARRNKEKFLLWPEVSAGSCHLAHYQSEVTEKPAGCREGDTACHTYPSPKQSHPLLQQSISSREAGESRGSAVHWCVYYTAENQKH